MSEHDFLFSLRLSENGGFDEMLHELTANVLRHVGYAAGPLASLGDEVRRAIAQGGGSGTEYELRFRAHAGSLDIVVLQGGRRLSSITRRLP